MSTYDPEQTGNYYVLGDSHDEMLQLIDSDRYFTKSMGGLLPEQPDSILVSIHDVLDIACGPGGWMLGLAEAFPDMQVTGLDISQEMIDYARVRARASQLENAHFQVGSAIEPLTFPDASFDLINARQIEGVIPTASWPSLLQEMARITRPGGIIRLTGNEWGISNSLAYETYMEQILQGFQKFGLSHAPDTRSFGITTMLSRYLRDVGCVNVQERVSFWDFSAGAPQHQEGYNMIMIGAELIEPFFLSAGITTQPAFHQLKGQLALEMAEDSFCGIIYTVTAWGHKPEVP